VNRLLQERFHGFDFVLVVAMVGLILAYAVQRAQAQGAAPKAAAAPAGNADNGKKLYKSYGCYQCHGYAGQGGAGARIAPKPIPFQAFVSYIRAPKGQMPPYTAKVLKESELADIHAFLQSLPEPPKAKDIPLLNNE